MLLQQSVLPEQRKKTSKNCTFLFIVQNGKESSFTKIRLVYISEIIGNFTILTDNKMVLFARLFVLSRAVVFVLVRGESGVGVFVTEFCGLWISPRN